MFRDGLAQHHDWSKVSEDLPLVTLGQCRASSPFGTDRLEPCSSLGRHSVHPLYLARRSSPRARAGGLFWADRLRALTLSRLAATLSEYAPPISCPGRRGFRAHRRGVPAWRTPRTDRTRRSDRVGQVFRGGSDRKARVPKCCLWFCFNAAEEGAASPNVWHRLLSMLRRDRFGGPGIPVHDGAPADLADRNCAMRGIL
jgi:hypothetical protein